VLAIGSTAIADTGRPPGPACRSSDASVSTALMIAVDSQEPTHLSHSDAAAAPVDRLPQRQPSSPVIVRRTCPARRPASRTRASRSPSAVSTATAKASSRRSRSARSLRSAAWPPNAERRAACLTRLLTHHISLIDTGPSATPAFHSALSS
jgi:hypothetical protein